MGRRHRPLRAEWWAVMELVPIFFLYGVTAIFSVIGLGISAVHSDDRYHWTRPFAGFLWPILAIIAILIVWSDRK